jgi:hypothetical protein
MKLAASLMAALIVLGTSVAVTSTADAKTVVRTVNHGPNCTTRTVRVREHGVMRTKTVRNCAPARHVAPRVVVRTPAVRTGVYIAKPSRHHCVTKTVTTRKHGVARKVTKRVCT